MLYNKSCGCLWKIIFCSCFFYAKAKDVDSAQLPEDMIYKENETWMISLSLKQKATGNIESAQPPAPVNHLLRRENWITQMQDLYKGLSAAAKQTRSNSGGGGSPSWFSCFHIFLTQGNELLSWSESVKTARHHSASYTIRYTPDNPSLIYTA